jgi:alkanesulfonate monooxygenase SsuD/methylene tetrahydromethanopterin reductase-like flavin-dependent oxidoreductase (luciferase family)
MRISIGLPSTIPSTPGALILDWARKADAGPFSSLSVLDRLVYPNYDSLITLSAAAAVTARVRLLTSVLLAPLHSAAQLAKQTASLDALSGGRLTLGLGVGVREDDFLAAEQDYHTRGSRFERQLETMHRIWSGAPVSEQIDRIGPAPAQAGGPEILIGGYSPQAIRRAGKWGVGYMAGGSPPDSARQGYEAVAAAWKAAGRPGKPRFVTATYFALGEDAATRGAAYLRDYYGASPYTDAVVAGLPATPEAVKARIQAFADVGADELTLWPTIAELDQVDRLAEFA